MVMTWRATAVDEHCMTRNMVDVVELVAKSDNKEEVEEYGRCRNPEDKLYCKEKLWDPRVWRKQFQSPLIEL